MTIYVDEPHEQKPDFLFNPTSDCIPEKTCVTKNFDSIHFSGKLANVPMNYTAMLGDGSKIIFVFGKDPTTERTVKPTTINQEPTAETTPYNSTTKTSAEPKTVPPEQTPSSGESSSNENNGGGSEHKTVPITSSGELIATSIVVVLYWVFAQVLAQ